MLPPVPAVNRGLKMIEPAVRLKELASMLKFPPLPVATVPINIPVPVSSGSNVPVKAAI